MRISTDGGRTWGDPSLVDASEGTPGSLWNPERGLYEPDMMVFPDGRIAVMYADETPATAKPAYSQVISMKTSIDGGRSWGDETRTVHDAPRPGMPIWTRMGNGAYILVYEMHGTEDCRADGLHWGSDLGKPIPDQMGAPYVLALPDGRLVVVISNTHHVSVSRNFGRTWRTDSKNNRIFGARSF